MQIKTTMRCHYTPIRMEKIRNNESIKCYKGYEEMSHSYTRDSITLYSHSGDYFGIFWKNQRYTSHKVQKLLLFSDAGEMKTYVHTKTWTWMLRASLFIIIEHWKKNQISFNGWIFRQIIIYPCYRILLSIIKK